MEDQIILSTNENDIPFEVSHRSIFCPWPLSFTVEMEMPMVKQKHEKSFEKRKLTNLLGKCAFT